MQFKVPQFIDIEDKLFGPYTFKQFAYLIGGAGMIFVLYKLLPFWIAILLIIPVAGFSAALAFYKYNGKPFIYYVEAWIAYTSKDKLYIWKQRIGKPAEKNNDIASIPKHVANLPANSSSKLNDISWNLEVTDQNKE